MSILDSIILIGILSFVLSVGVQMDKMRVRVNWRELFLVTVLFFSLGIVSLFVVILVIYTTAFVSQGLIEVISWLLS